MAARPGGFIWLLTCALFGVISACGDDSNTTSTNGGGSTSAASEIRIDPPWLYVEEGAVFELRARLFTASGEPLVGVTGEPTPGAPAITWSPQSGIGLTAIGSYRAHFKADFAAGSHPYPVAVDVMAAGGSPTAKAIVYVVPNRVTRPAPPWPVDDRVEDPSTAVEPLVAIVDGLEAQCLNDEIVPFVKWAWLPDLTTDCPPDGSRPEIPASVTVFSRSDRMRLQAFTWHPGADTVELSSGARSVPPFTAASETGSEPPSGDPADEVTGPSLVPVKIWTAALTNAHTGNAYGPGELLGIAHDDLKLANEIFAANRAGVRFEVRGETELAVNVEVAPDVGTVVVNGTDVLATPVNVCTSVAQSAQLDISAPTSMSSSSSSAITITPGKVVHLFYVDFLSGAGFSCIDADVIFINEGTRVPTTLAHELGHKLGLRDPDIYPVPTDGIGHTDYGNAKKLLFSGENLMWRGIVSTWQAPRRHISLGQIFRIHADGTRSWLAINLPAQQDTVLACGPKYTEEVPCPILNLDPQ
jgi:hypothetical protein